MDLVHLNVQIYPIPRGWTKYLESCHIFRLPDIIKSPQKHYFYYYYYYYYYYYRIKYHNIFDKFLDIDAMYG